MRAYVSNSISNFKEKILKNWGLKEWDRKNLTEPVLFIGLYNARDHQRFFTHKGKKIVIWCGSDIFQTGLVFRKIQKIPARHICENRLEWGVLLMQLGGIEPEIHPLFFGDRKKYKTSFTPSRFPHVYLFSHKDYGAEKQAGLHIVHRIAHKVPFITFHIYGLEGKNWKNVKYHGFLPEEKLDQEIAKYQCGLRLHEFDGFSENTAKSVLMGQYPITRVYYPFIDQVSNDEQLIFSLKELRGKKKPNPVQKYYQKLLAFRP